jgi:hypothetical protein
MTKSHLAAIALTAASLFGTSLANAAPEMVTNGGFEASTSGPGFLGISTNLIGWTASSGYAAIVAPGTANGSGIVLNGTPYYLWGPGTNGGNVANGLTATSPSGGNFISSDAHADTAVMLSQTLTGLTVGATYQVSFSFAAAQYRMADGSGWDGASQSGWNVNIGPQAFATGELAIASHGFSGWQTASFTHIASSANEVLSFLANGGPAGAPPAALLDGVSVTQVANVPEPGTLMLLSLAGLLGAAASRKKKQA